MNSGRGAATAVPSPRCMTAPSALAVPAARHFPSLNQCQVKLNKARFVETLP